MMLNVLIPCAGTGQRFKDAGYKEPKPLIDVLGTPMIEASIKSLLPSRYDSITLVFATLRDHNIDLVLYRMFPKVKYIVDIVDVGFPTNGSLCSCLAARNIIATSIPLVIANCDQIIEGGWGDLPSRNADGAILTMKGDGSKKWSYVKVDKGLVSEVKEKEPISDRATCGVYWFARGIDFVDAADKMIAANDTTNGEFYVAPVYNYFIKYGLKVDEVPIENYGGVFHGLGTPEDLQAYIESKK